MKRQTEKTVFSWETAVKQSVSMLLCIFLMTGCGACEEQPETVVTVPVTETQPLEAETVPPETEPAVDDRSVPEYWMESLDAGAKAIRQAVQKAGMDRSAFLFYTDSHWNYSARMSPRLLTYLYDHTPLNKVIFGGDIVQTEPGPEEGEQSQVMDYLWQWRSEVRDLKHYSVVGNHDDGEDTNNLFSYEYVYTYLFAPEDSKEIVRGGYTYYYFDDVCEKTRYLCLDTAYEGVYNLTSEQKVFLEESLKSTPEGWHIVVVAHAWYAPDYANIVPGEPVQTLGLTPRAAAVAEVLDQYNARSGRFRNAKARVEFCIGGHLHRDYVGATPGGIPIALCETDSRQVRSGLEYIESTDSEAAVSGIVADYTDGILSVVRIGRGSSFEVELRSQEEAEVTDTGAYTNVLDTVGYTDGYRLSAGSGLPVVCANTDLTGLIPVKKGDIIRLKNLEMPDTLDDYYAVIGYYLPDETYLQTDFIHSALRVYAPVYSKEGNLVQFTVTNDQAAYLRLCAKEIGPDSIVTVNEKIQ